MQVSRDCGHAAVDFLRKGLPFIMGAQTGFHVSESHLSEVAEKGGDGNRCRISLSQHPIRVNLFEYRIEVKEDFGAQAAKRLVLPHQIQVEIRSDIEQIQYLIEHLSVLGGRADARFNPTGLAEQADDRCQFHGFGAGSNYRKNF